MLARSRYMSVVLPERRSARAREGGDSVGAVGRTAPLGGWAGFGGGPFPLLPTPDRYVPASRSLRASASTPTGIPTAIPPRYPFSFVFQLDFQPWQSWPTSWLKAPPSYAFC